MGSGSLPHRITGCVILPLILTLTMLGGQAAATPSPPHAQAPAVQSSAATARTPGNYTPVTRAHFNNPLGGEAAQRRLFTHLIRTINSTPRRAAIRFAVHSFSDRRMADALLAAHRRGVRVKLVFAGKNVYKPMRRLQRAIGSNPNQRSFVVFCDRSCRGTAGHLHTKFFSFSRAGGARHITMVGSNNITDNNAQNQWNDLYTVADARRYFEKYKPWFAQLKRDRPVADPYLSMVNGRHRMFITPLEPAKDADPIMGMLNQMSCKGGRIDPGELLISMHAWNGPRGQRLARKVAGLSRAGCRVWVAYGVGVGPAVRAILSDAGVKLKGGQKGGSTHQKLMIYRGAYAGQESGRMVVTGSHNWSAKAFPRDDMIVSTRSREIVTAYRHAFWRMWNQG